MLKAVKHLRYNCGTNLQFWPHDSYHCDWDETKTLRHGTDKTTLRHGALRTLSTWDI